MTIFMTVGTSALLENRTLGTVPRRTGRKQPSKAAAVALEQDIKGFLKGVNEKVDVDPEFRDSLKKRLIEEHLGYWEQPDAYRFDANNVGKTSAELSSTLSLIRAEREDGRELAPERLVLIQTPTDDGRLAAEVNEEVFRHVRGLGLLPHRAKVVVVEVNAEAHDLGSVEMALQEKTRPLASPGRNIFNITGGFKGLIPSITVLAIRRGWELFYRHETRQDRGYLVEPLQSVGFEPDVAEVPLWLVKREMRFS